MENVFLKKAWIAGIILLFISSSVVAGLNTNSTSSSQPLNRGWLYVGGSGPGNYTRIQNAINDSHDGDTVFVYNGTYYENLVINVSIALIGEEKNTTIIDGSEMEYIVFVSVDWVNISGFTIQNSSRDYPASGAGIRIYSCYSTISGNTIMNNTGWDGEGIILSGDSNTISGNTITNNTGSGISLSGNNNTMSGNTNTYNRIGITLSGESNAISGNTITENQIDGIGFSGSNNIVSDNTITNDHCGIGLCGINNTISGNIITNNNYQSIWIYDGSDYNNIINNTITNNCYGIYFYNYCVQNIIYHNNFINNEQAAFDHNSNNIWYNALFHEGNYWSDYTGNDVNGDGIGDIPYNIPGGSNQDLYPLMYPFEKYFILQIILPNMPIYEGQDFPILVHSLANIPIQDAMVEFDGVSYTTDSNGTVWLTAPRVEADTLYEITTNKAGYVGANETILVRNIPEEFVKAFTFGKIANLSTQGDYITFEAVKTRVITFSPFSFNTYAYGKKFTISKDYQGWVGTRYIFALCELLI